MAAGRHHQRRTNRRRRVRGASWRGLREGSVRVASARSSSSTSPDESTTPRCVACAQPRHAVVRGAAQEVAVLTLNASLWNDFDSFEVAHHRCCRCPIAVVVVGVHKSVVADSQKDATVNAGANLLHNHVPANARLRCASPSSAAHIDAGIRECRVAPAPSATTTSDGGGEEG